MTARSSMACREEAARGSATPADLCAATAGEGTATAASAEHVMSDQGGDAEKTREIPRASPQVTPQVTLAPLSGPPRARRQTADRPPTSRSAVTNGSRLLVGVNAGSALGRRFRDLVEALERELGDSLGEAERLMVRNAASLQLHVDALTAQLARGEAVDPEAFTRATNAASRAITALRRRKPAKGRGPGVADYLRAKQGGGR